MLHAAVLILAFILFAGIIWWCATKLIAAFGIPEPLATVIIVVLILVMLIAFLGQTGIISSGDLRLR